MREEGTFLRSEEVTENDHAFRDGSGTFDAWRVDLESGQVLRVKDQDVRQCATLLCHRAHGSRVTGGRCQKQAGGHCRGRWPVFAVAAR